EAIRLACRLKLKPLHHISLTDVALYQDDEGVWVIDEHPADVYPRGIFMSGYAQTKWVAERLVSLVQKRGLPVTIYRPGFIDGTAEAGYPAERFPYPEWREQVLAEVAPNPEHPLYPLLPYSVDEEIARMPLAFPCDTTNTLTALEGSGISCPRIELGVLKKCLDFLVSVGFLSPPPQPRPVQGEAVAPAEP